MKFLLLFILVPHFAIASALVMKDDLNKIFNVIAVLNFPEKGISELSAADLTYDADFYLNSLAPEVEVSGETWTVLFNLDYQFNYSKYPLSDSCAHNSLSLNEISKFTTKIKDIQFSNLIFTEDKACFGEGSPLEI